MAENDVIRVTSVATFGSVNCVNQFYFQEEQGPTGGEDQLETVIEAWQEDWLPQLKAIATDEVQWECITARRTHPSPTDVATKFIQEKGDISNEALPSTSHVIMRYWALPHNKRDSNHWKLFGIPEANTYKGKVREQLINQLQLFSEFIAGNKLSRNGGSWALIRPYRVKDGVPGQLPRVQLAFYGNTIRSTRNRQFQVCTG